MCIIVFCGASLEKKEIEEILGNDVYVVPPIKRGDLKKYKDGNIIAIIDGIFGGMLAISPQESKRLIFRYDRKNPRLLFSSRSTLTVHI